jgi:transcriptional regulator with XRE-family HTH domain
MNLKKQLSAYLKAKNISASELSRITGIPKQSISDWLAGSNPRDIRLVKKVADVFSVSIDHLFFGEGVEEKQNQAPLVSVKVENSGEEEWISGVFEGKFRRLKS